MKAQFQIFIGAAAGTPPMCDHACGKVRSLKKEIIDYDFLDRLEKQYFEMSFMELSMEYYVLKEKENEGEDVPESDVSEYRTSIEELVRECLQNYDGINELKTRAESLREDLKNRVTLLMKKIDRLDIDRYIEKRLENAEEQYDYPDDDEAARAILRMIFEVNDNNVINEKIKTAVYELPVRITKTRFLDIVKNGLMCYIGSDSDILERVMYMLECTSGMLGDEIPAEVFGDRDKDSLMQEYEYLDILMEICNYICVISCCDEKLRKEEKEKVDHILKLINISTDLSPERVNDAQKLLETLEGTIESLSENLAVSESRFAGIVDSGEINDEKVKRLVKMMRLMSSSRYADLETEKVETVTEEDVETLFDQFSVKISKCFDDGDRTLNRARMAAVLSALPVFFNSRTEVMDYVRNSLSSCSNIHEKNVAVSQIMNMSY